MGILDRICLWIGRIFIISVALYLLFSTFISIIENAEDREKTEIEAVKEYRMHIEEEE